MNYYIELLQKELSNYAAKTGLKETPSVLELLWQNYLQVNPMDDGLIKEREEALTPVFRELSVASSDILNGLIANLYTAYQRAALLEGIYIGAQIGILCKTKGAPHE